VSANPERGEVELLIGGGTRVLLFTLDAIARVISDLELDGIESIMEPVGSLEPHQMAVYVLHGLRHEGKEDTLDSIMEKTLPIVTTRMALYQALNYSLWGDVKGPLDETLEAENQSPGAGAEQEQQQSSSLESGRPITGD
jgi:hypothetical protein